MYRFKWNVADAEPVAFGRRLLRMDIESSSPSGLPGYGKRHDEKDSQLKQGPSGQQPPSKDQPAKPPVAISRLERARSSDEAIVSDDATGQNNPTPSQGPLDRKVATGDTPTPAQSSDCPKGLHG